MPGRRQHAEGSLYQRSSDGRWIAVVHLGWKGGKRQRRVFTGSAHPNGMNYLLCDGSVRFMTNKTERKTWYALTTRDGLNSADR